jgi:hypothetical protein
MITFPESATDDEIRRAVVDWSELLAQGRYADALAMFAHTSESFGFSWTPAHLEDWISNYGCPRAKYDSGEYRTVSSLFEQPDPDEYVRQAIDVDRDGVDAAPYVGMVHYDDVPLDGRPSDLTARFHIKRIGGGRITLEFLDIHVM